MGERMPTFSGRVDPGLVPADPPPKNRRHRLFTDDDAHSSLVIEAIMVPPISWNMTENVPNALKSVTIVVFVERCSLE